MYLTVEEVAQSEVDRAFGSLPRAGCPRYGARSSIRRRAGATTTTRARGQAVEWLAHEGLEIADEGFSQEDGWGYRHFLLRISG